ncbi:hypothetical protein B0H14DRAFT_2586241 [Mycena olivaceomarginata]|nr:hypothetical protein B0H14DRAFT_2586241 [Mycena olivaceomarginata]
MSAWQIEPENLRHSSPAPTAATTPARHYTARRRSSSVSDPRILTLEEDLKDARASLTQRETELCGATTKLAQAQNDLVKVENEKLASDKRLHAEIWDLRVALQEKDMQCMKEQPGDGGRGEELMKRIDEEIATLEKLLADASETQALRERLWLQDQKLLTESERVLEMEGRLIELVREKEEALDEVEEARGQSIKLSDELRQKEAIIADLKAKQQEMHNASRLRPPVEQDVERLLGAVQRIRGERDDLRRDLHFVQIEARFTEEALKARIAALMNDSPSSTADRQLQAEVQLLRQQLANTRPHGQSILHEKHQEIRRMCLAAMASAVVIGHLQSQAGRATEQLLRAFTASEDATEDTFQRLKDVQLQMRVAAQNLEAMTRQRDELLSHLAYKGSEWMKERAEHQEAQDQLAEFVPPNDVSRPLYDVEKERDYLKNLSKDLEAAQREIAEAETRYSALEFDQLTSMTTNEAAQALRMQLADQAARVLRRTELIGILQHDSKRLETNLKLQEERLSEMTKDLEVMAAEQDAVVHDCADARQARDAAISRVKDLEVELEGRSEGGDATVCAMVGVVMDTVSRSRRALRQASLHANRQPEAEAEALVRPDGVAELNKHQNLQVLASSVEASRPADTKRLTDQLAGKDRLVSAHDLEDELASFKVKHVEEMGLLQGRLVQMTNTLDEVQARCGAAEENYRQALSDSTRSKQELESAAGDAEKQDDGRIRNEHAAAVERLQDQVASAVTESESRELESLHQRTVTEPAQADETSQELEAPVVELNSPLEEQTTQSDALSEGAEALRHQLDQKKPEAQELSVVAEQVAEVRGADGIVAGREDDIAGGDHHAAGRGPAFVVLVPISGKSSQVKRTSGRLPD